MRYNIFLIVLKSIKIYGDFVFDIIYKCMKSVYYFVYCMFISIKIKIYLIKL